MVSNVTATPWSLPQQPVGPTLLLLPFLLYPVGGNDEGQSASGSGMPGRDVEIQFPKSKSRSATCSPCDLGQVYSASESSVPPLLVWENTMSTF